MREVNLQRLPQVVIGLWAVQVERQGEIDLLLGVLHPPPGQQLNRNVRVAIQLVLQLVDDLVLGLQLLQNSLQGFLGPPFSDQSIELLALQLPHLGVRRVQFGLDGLGTSRKYVGVVPSQPLSFLTPVSDGYRLVLTLWDVYRRVQLLCRSPRGGGAPRLYRLQ